MSNYEREHFDHLFYRMRESQPTSNNFYTIITIIKLFPMFVQLNSLGYSELNDGSATLHSYFRYFSMSFFLQNSIDINNIITISTFFLILNISLISILFYYLSTSKKIKKIDENFGTQNSLNCFFTFFSIFTFFKFVLLNQFFHEINFMPLICFSEIDINKVNKNEIISQKIDENYLSKICTEENLALFISVSVLNFLIDIFMNYLLISRFFDQSILSQFFWNCCPNPFHSILYFESFYQIFFILFLNYDNKKYREFILYYYFFNIFIYILMFFNKKNTFYTINTKNIKKLIEFVRIMCFIGTSFVSFFYFFYAQFPSDLVLIFLIIIEILLAFVAKYFLDKNDEKNIVKLLINTNLNGIDIGNIGNIICYLITEFEILNDFNKKFDDERLDLFLSNYVIHIKNCEDNDCPCKNMVKKFKDDDTNKSNNNNKGYFYTNDNNTGNTGYTANIEENKAIAYTQSTNRQSNYKTSNNNLKNLNSLEFNTNNPRNFNTNSHIENNNNFHTNNKSDFTSIIANGNFYNAIVPAEDDYIVNKFFYNLTNKAGTLIETNYNININSIKDSDKQKVRYNLRLKLISEVKKLISYKLEKFYINLNSTQVIQLPKILKHFIRINFFALNLLLNKEYYKTIFLYHEFLTDFFLKNKKNYNENLIFYFYLKKSGIKDYNNFLIKLKNDKKEKKFKIDFNLVLGNCTKFFQIEKKILKTVHKFRNFISYFERDLVYFDRLLLKIKKFKNSYKSLTEYIRFFFKNDKINNLYITSKIILFYKIIQFDIPDSLGNKLVIQNYENEEMQNSSKKYVDTNYYLIANYKNSNFLINFVSHELLILLNYKQSDLKDEDFHILMPEKMRDLHKNLIINEIKDNKYRNATLQYKEIFLVSKDKDSILFDLHFKLLLNLQGEITILCVFNLKKIRNDFKTAFISLDNTNEILAVNKEFQDYFLITMKMLEYMKIDSNKLILQGLNQRMEAFFNEEENLNSEFYDRFDYELYLLSLFAEEFETLKDKNENLYNRQIEKYYKLLEILKKQMSNKFFDIYAKVQQIEDLRIYFVRFFIRINISKSYKSLIPALSPIERIKESKRQIVKLSSVKPDEIEEEANEHDDSEDLSERRDFLNGSQSILSSAAMLLKSSNKKRMFKSRNKNLIFLPKSRNIILLGIFLGFFTICSFLLNLIFLSLIINLINESKDFYSLSNFSLILNYEISYVTKGVMNIALLQNDLLRNDLKEIINEKNFADFEENIKINLSESLNEISKIYYHINQLNNLYFNEIVDKKINEKNFKFEFLFENGLIYKKEEYINLNFEEKNVKTFFEISTIRKKVMVLLKKFEDFLDLEKKIKFLENEKIGNDNNSKELLGLLEERKNFEYFREFILFEKIKKFQEKIKTEGYMKMKFNDIEKEIKFEESDEFIFYFLFNTFDNFLPYLNELQIIYENLFKENQDELNNKLLTLLLIQFFVVAIVIFSQYIFILIGFEKVKKKIKDLKIKIKSNNVLLTQQKITEFIKFCDSFSILSFCYISDFDIQNNPEENKTEIKTFSFNDLNKSDYKNIKFIPNPNPNPNPNTNPNPNPIPNTNTNPNDNNNRKKSDLNLKFNSENNNTNISLMNNSCEINNMTFSKKEINKNKTLNFNYLSEKTPTSFFESSTIKSANFNNIGYSHSKNFKETNIGYAKSKTFKESIIQNLNSQLNNNEDERNINNEENSIYLNHMENINQLNFNISNWEKKDELRNVNTIDTHGILQIMENNIDENSSSEDADNRKYKYKSNNNLSSNFNLNLKNSFQRSKPINENDVIESDLNKKLTFENEFYIENTNENDNSAKDNINLKKSKTDIKKSSFEKTEKKSYLDISKKIEKINNELNPNNLFVSNNTSKISDSNSNYSLPQVNDNENIIDKNKKKINKLDENKSFSFMNNYNNSNLNNKEIEYQNNNNNINETQKFNKNNLGNSRIENKDYTNTNKIDNIIKDNIIKNLPIKHHEESKDNNNKSNTPIENESIMLLDNKKLIKKNNNIQNLNSKKEMEIDNAIDQIVYKRHIPKIFLLIFSLIFIILYALNIFFNFTYVAKISQINYYSKIIQKRIGLIDKLFLKYQNLILLNSTNFNFYEEKIFFEIEENQKELVKMKNKNDLDNLPLTLEFENVLNTNEFCDFFSKKFSEVFSKNEKIEFEECSNIGNNINSKGFYNAYSLVYNNLKINYNDLTRLKDLSEEKLMEKLMDGKLFDIKMETDFTFMKMKKLERWSIGNDLDSLYGSFLSFENLFMWMSLFLCVVFCLTSFMIVILPIKNVESVISWLIKKLLKEI